MGHFLKNILDPVFFGRLCLLGKTPDIGFPLTRVYSMLGAMWGCKAYFGVNRGITYSLLAKAPPCRAKEDIIQVFSHSELYSLR